MAKRSRRRHSGVVAAPAGVRPSPVAAVDRSGAVARHLRGWGLSILVFIVAIAPFRAAIHAEFTNWDDHANITENRDFRGLSAQHFRWFFSTYHVGVYEPLSWMLKATIHEFAGISAVAFHAVTVGLHGCNAVLFFWIARRLLRAAAAPVTGWALELSALLAVLLFAVHPLRSEVVAWASGQPYALAGFFSLASLLVWLRTVDPDAGPRTGAHYWLGLISSIVLYAAALLSKTAAISLPVAMLLLDWIPLGRLAHPRTRRRAVLEKTPYLVLAASMALLASSISVRSQVPDAQAPLFERLFVAAQAPAVYLFKTLVPIGLTPFYPLPFPYTGVPRQFVLMSVATLAISTALVVAVVLHRRTAKRKRQASAVPIDGQDARGTARTGLAPAMLAGWLFALVYIAPVSGIVRHGDAYAADRYTYLAGMGYALLAAACALLGIRRIARHTTAAILAGSLVAFTALWVLTHRQTSHWRDSGTLWRHALTVHPTSWLARHNLASWHLRRGEPAVAAGMLDALLKDCPDYVDAMFTYGSALRDLNRLDDACNWFNRTLERQPDHECVNNLADTLDTMGRTDEAIVLLRERLRRTPNDPGILLNLGVFVSKRGQPAEGLAMFERVARMQPWNDQALFNFGAACLNAGRLADAGSAMAEVLRINRASSRAWLYAALTKKAEGRVAEAEPLLRECLRLEPGYSRARFELGVVLMELGRERDAVTEWRAAASDPREPLAAFRLAWALATSNDAAIRNNSDARAIAQRLVTATTRREPRMLLALAAAHADAGAYGDAATLVTEAQQLNLTEPIRRIARRMIEAIMARTPIRENWNENG